MNPNNLIKHGHKVVKICVSGAAETGHCGVDALDKAKELGRQIAKRGAILVTGSSTGFSMWVAMGAKEEGGMVIGFSPAVSEREHVEVYKLPIDYMDMVIYTGFGYAGRDILLVRSTDALICGCGRIGTIHNFTTALEEDKPIGIYEGPWDTGEELREILSKGHKSNARVVSVDDPNKILDELFLMIHKEKVDHTK